MIAALLWLVLLTISTTSSSGIPVTVLFNYTAHPMCLPPPDTTPVVYIRLSANEIINRYQVMRLVWWEPSLVSLNVNQGSQFSIVCLGTYFRCNSSEILSVTCNATEFLVSSFDGFGALIEPTDMEDVGEQRARVLPYCALVGGSLNSVNNTSVDSLFVPGGGVSQHLGPLTVCSGNGECITGSTQCKCRGMWTGHACDVCSCPTSERCDVARGACLLQNGSSAAGPLAVDATTSGLCVVIIAARWLGKTILWNQTHVRFNIGNISTAPENWQNENVTVVDPGDSRFGSFNATAFASPDWMMVVMGGPRAQFVLYSTTVQSYLHCGASFINVGPVASGIRCLGDDVDLNRNFFMMAGIAVVTETSFRQVAVYPTGCQWGPGGGQLCSGHGNCNDSTFYTCQCTSAFDGVACDSSVTLQPCRGLEANPPVTSEGSIVSTEWYHPIIPFSVARTAYWFGEGGWTHRSKFHQLGSPVPLKDMLDEELDQLQLSPCSVGISCNASCLQSISSNCSETAENLLVQFVFSFAVSGNLSATIENPSPLCDSEFAALSNFVVAPSIVLDCIANGEELLLSTYPSRLRIAQLRNGEQHPYFRLTARCSSCIPYIVYQNSPLPLSFVFFGALKTTLLSLFAFLLKRRCRRLMLLVVIPCQALVGGNCLDYDEKRVEEERKQLQLSYDRSWILEAEIASRLEKVLGHKPSQTFIQAYDELLSNNGSRLPYPPKHDQSLQPDAREGEQRKLISSNACSAAVISALHELEAALVAADTNMSAHTLQEEEDMPAESDRAVFLNVNSNRSESMARCLAVLDNDDDSFERVLFASRMVDSAMTPMRWVLFVDFLYCVALVLVSLVDAINQQRTQYLSFWATYELFYFRLLNSSTIPCFAVSSVLSAILSGKQNVFTRRVLHTTAIGSEERKNDQSNSKLFQQFSDLRLNLLSHPATRSWYCRCAFIVLIPAVVSHSLPGVIICFVLVPILAGSVAAERLCRSPTQWFRRSAALWVFCRAVSRLVLNFVVSVVLSISFNVALLRLYHHGENGYTCTWLDCITLELDSRSLACTLNSLTASAVNFLQTMSSFFP